MRPRSLFLVFVVCALLVSCAPKMLPLPAAAPTSMQGEQTAPRALTAVEQVQRLTPAEAKARLDKGQAVLYDIRSPESYQAKHAAGALSLPGAELETLASTLPKDKGLIFY